MVGRSGGPDEAATTDRSCRFGWRPRTVSPAKPETEWLRERQGFSGGEAYEMHDSPMDCDTVDAGSTRAGTTDPDIFESERRNCDLRAFLNLLEFLGRHTLQTQRAHVSIPVNKQAVFTVCPPDAAAMGATCGTVNVPFDRKRPELGQIGIYFELYPHFGPGPAESAILAKAGPGVTASGLRWTFLYLFGPNLDKHDVLLIDDRGSGLSGTIDCPDLQHGTAPYEQSVAECAAQLGEGASRYGTGDIAQDTDDVRASLGYEKIDYFGWSYGGQDVAAYAARFGQHVRSLVLDSPVVGPPEEFAFERYRTAASPREIRLVRALPNCAIDHPFTDLELNTLIWTLRLHPIEGDAYDANGNLKHVRVDEGNLLTHIIINPVGNMTNIGEVLAAGAALRQGVRSLSFDSKPRAMPGLVPSWIGVTRLGGVRGAKAARIAADFRVPWKWHTPVWEREEAYSRALDKLPSNWFWPFSKQAGTRPEIDFIHAYLNWEEPTPFVPGLPLHPVFPNVPTLVLAGDLDIWCPLEEGRDVAAQFPGSRYVRVAEAGHGAVFYSQCAVGTVSRFIETLETGDMSCAAIPDVVFPALGAFPRVAEKARPAGIDPSGTNQIGIAERKVVTVAIAMDRCSTTRYSRLWRRSRPQGRHISHRLWFAVDHAAKQFPFCSGCDGQRDSYLGSRPFPRCGPRCQRIGHCRWLTTRGGNLAGSGASRYIQGHGYTRRQASCCACAWGVIMSEMTL